jgi:hypothetical protein
MPNAPPAKRRALRLAPIAKTLDKSGSIWYKSRTMASFGTPLIGGTGGD